MVFMLVHNIVFIVAYNQQIKAKYIRKLPYNMNMRMHRASRHVLILMAIYSSCLEWLSSAPLLYVNALETIRYIVTRKTITFSIPKLINLVYYVFE